MLKYEELPEVNSERWLSVEDLEGEIWKDILDYEERYEISNYGRLRTKERTVVYVNGFVHNYKPVIMKEHIIKDYYSVTLRDDLGNDNCNWIHRLVARTFLPNPDNLPSINHKDENKLNNTLSNLEFCTVKYNNRYGNRMKKIVNTMIANGNTTRVALYDERGDIVKEYDSVQSFCSAYGVDNAVAIDCLNGRISSAHGYNIRKAGEEYTPRKSRRITYTYHIYKGNKFLGTYTGCDIACKAIGVTFSCLYRASVGETTVSRKLKDYTIYVEPFGCNEGFVIDNGVRHGVTEEERSQYFVRFKEGCNLFSYRGI